MNTINEIKEMLEKLNDEIESLRAENAELKHRLARYEPIGNIDMTIEDMDLSTRSYNSLRNDGINTVADILKYDARRLRRIRDFGKKSLTEVIEKMEELGFDEWVSKVR